jgi:hypothetical protein
MRTSRVEGSANVALRRILHVRLAWTIIVANGACDSPDLVSTSSNDLSLVLFVGSPCTLFDSRLRNMTTEQRSSP